MLDKMNNKMKINLISIILVLLLVFAGIIGLFIGSDQVTASGPTEVSGIISTDTTWTLGNSPYIVIGNTLVEKNIKLIIDPGVIVKFDSDRYLQVDGSLQAIGTEEENIVFTSNEEIPTPGDWGGLRFENTSNGSILEYCTIEYGGGKNVDGRILGGGIYNNANELEIQYCKIVNNYAKTGGGIYCLGSMNISQSEIFNNSAYDKGGGLMNFYGGTLNIDKCNIFNNSVGVGSGISNYGHIMLNNSNIFNNYASPFGGIDNSLSIEIVNSSIFKNSVDDEGAGIYNKGIAKIVKSNIYENTCHSFGGGILNDNVLSITESIVTANSASYGGGIADRSGSSDISYCKISNNSGYGIYGDSSIRCTSIINNTGGGGIYGNPPKIKFSNLNNINYELKLISESNVIATDNWWGTIDKAKIDEKIYDYYDDFSLGKVSYSPLKNSQLKISNPAPVVNAGPDQNTTTTELVYFNGSNSYDPYEDPLQYKWDFGDGNSTGWQSDSDSSHNYTVAGNYTVTLYVSDGSLTDTDVSFINVIDVNHNNAPVADAGLDQETTFQQSVYFDGSGSWDQDNDSLKFKWDFGNGASTEWLSDCNTSYRFDIWGYYTVTLYVNDGDLNGSDTCIVTITSEGGTYPPTDLDSDNDGYNDTIEKKEGTNIFSNISVPKDFDKDFIPDSMDEDIDGDGVRNSDDDFPYDETRSKKEEKSSDLNLYLAIVFIIILIIALISMVIFRRKRKS